MDRSVVEQLFEVSSVVIFDCSLSLLLGMLSVLVHFICEYTSTVTNEEWTNTECPDDSQGTAQKSAVEPNADCWHRTHKSAIITGVVAAVLANELKTCKDT